MYYEIINFHWAHIFMDLLDHETCIQMSTNKSFKQCMCV